MFNTRAGSIGLGLAILVSVAGLALTGLMLEYHAALATGSDSILRPLCERVEGFDCQTALTSASATTFGLPTVFLGFIYFAAVTAWFLIVGRPSGARYSWHWFAVLLTAGGAAFAGYLAWVNFTKLPTPCLLCAIAHGLAGLLFILTLLIWPRRRSLVVMAEPTAGLSRDLLPVRVAAPDYPPGRALLAWVLMAVAISALGWLVYQGRISSERISRDLARLRESVHEEVQAAKRYETEADLARAEVENFRKAAEQQAAKLKAQAEKQAAELKAQTERAAAEAKAALEKAGVAEQQRAVLADELEKARAALEESQRAVQQAEARLKDYENDYQAVWFNFVNEPVINIPMDPTDSIYGRVDAPHTIVMFSDLQCPFCKGADKLLREKIAKYPDQLRLVVKHFPLNKTCNEHVTGSPHPAACAAAVTVEAARALGGEDAFWKMYDALFADQAGFAKDPKGFVREATAAIGIDHDELWKKINTTSIWNRVREHTAQGGRIGVQSTPAVYYDGRHVAGWANSKFWDYIMWREKQGAAPAPAPAETQPGATTQP